MKFTRQQLRSSYFKYDETIKGKSDIKVVANRKSQQGNVKYQKWKLVC